MLKLLIYRFKILIREKENLFWVFAFPIILVSLFHLAFSNLNENDTFQPPTVAVFGNKDAAVVKTIENLKNNDQKLVNVKYKEEEEAIKELEEDKVDGVLKVEGEEYKLILHDDSVKQLILVEILNTYKQQNKMFENIYLKNPNLEYKDLVGPSMKTYLKEMPVTEKANNMYVVTLFSAIAMACLYNAMGVAMGVGRIQPNISGQGIRVSVAPCRKSKMIFIDFFANVTNGIAALLVLLLYMKTILKVDFGDNVWPIAAICIVGAMFATSMGYLIALITKKSKELNVAIVISVTMLGSFLAGMMSPQIKYWVDSNLPIIKYVNPVGLITDSFYALYYYDDYSMIYKNMGVLAIMFIAAMTISINILRRQKYDSV